MKRAPTSAKKPAAKRNKTKDQPIHAAQAMLLGDHELHQAGLEGELQAIQAMLLGDHELHQAGLEGELRAMDEGLGKLEVQMNRLQEEYAEKKRERAEKQAEYNANRTENYSNLARVEALSAAAGNQLKESCEQRREQKELLGLAKKEMQQTVREAFERGGCGQPDVCHLVSEQDEARARLAELRAAHPGELKQKILLEATARGLKERESGNVTATHYLSAVDAVAKLNQTGQLNRSSSFLSQSLLFSSQDTIVTPQASQPEAAAAEGSQPFSLSQ